MHDIHSITGGRIFGGGGDRRLRPHHHQALKCPRCDSLDTKFCYYNNYNLSQPRHFCKSCRRHWTRGGVLRNVPVGGGCRKTKRSKVKSSSRPDPSPVAAETATSTTADASDRKASSHSSSESSSLTATNTSAAAEAVSATSSSTPPSFFDSDEYKSIITQNMNEPLSNHGFDQGLLEQSSGCWLFSDTVNFSSLITAKSLPFGFGSILDQNSHWSQQQDQERKIHHHQTEGAILSSSNGCPFFQQTVQVDMLSEPVPDRPPDDEVFGPLDWQPATDQELFDVPGAVDQACWSQNSQWADEDHQTGLRHLP